MSKRLTATLAMALLVALAPAAFAGGAKHYPNGAESFWMGAAPPPGLYFMDYNMFYDSHEFMDAGGDEVKAGPLAGFKANVYANVPRFIWITDKQIFGANYGMHLFVPIMDIDVKTRFAHDHQTGLGDIIFDPFILSWHWKTFHLTTAVDIYAPTGEFDQGNMANPGLNLWTFEPIVAFTWQFVENVPLSFSMKFMYDFNTKNSQGTSPLTGMEADVTPGQELHFDYSLDYMINDTWKVGVTGYLYHQTTLDEVNGSHLSGDVGKRSETFAIGPAVEWHMGKLFLRGTYTHEINSRNMPLAQTFWLTLTCIF